MRTAVIENGVVVNVILAQSDFKWPPYDLVASENAQIGWIYNAGEFAPPQNDFNLAEHLPAYRDLKILINVSYAGHTVLNNDMTRKRLNERSAALDLKGGETLTAWLTLDGYKDLAPEEIKGLYLACADRLQACFDAAHFVETNHAQTPYKNWDEAQAAFDKKLDECK